MYEINQLEVEVANKIAAGEVVERPASVIKELVENSIDAGAVKIEIKIENGGKDKIQVIDNGTGIKKSEISKSIERFSTSKLNTYEDLEKLMTYGFRGEALASIASISIMEIKTKFINDKEGTLLKSEGSDIKSVKRLPWNKGTCITISNLFYNTPARKKFQKNTLSEVRQIYKVFKYFALANPEINFVLKKEGKTIWDLKPSKLNDRINILFSENLSDNLIEISYEENDRKIHGFISTPEWKRSNRSDQYLFLNKRYIKNRIADHGIYQGYGTTLSHGSGHPFYVLMLDMPPEKFDINIHPTKIEAKFQDEKAIHHSFSAATKSALGTAGTDFIRSNTYSSSAEIFENKNYNPNQPVQSNLLFPKSDNTIEFSSYKQENESQIDSEMNTELNEGIVKKNSIEKEKVWQVHQCFIFAQVKSGLILIDQHTAHERVLYEKTLKMMHKNEKSSQQLLFPQSLVFDLETILILNEVKPYLEKIGFEIKIFGEDTVIIDAVPTDVKMGREFQVIKDIIREYSGDEFKDIDIHDRIARMYACRSAIMKGDNLTTDEMFRLIDDLFATDFPYYCPHGRPTVVDMSLKELNSKFFR